MESLTLHQGTTPLVVSVPHAGTFMPESVKADLTLEARKLPDTRGTGKCRRPPPGMHARVAGNHNAQMPTQDAAHG